jgi:hypothetical protein
MLSGLLPPAVIFRQGKEPKFRDLVIASVAARRATKMNRWAHNTGRCKYCGGGGGGSGIDVAPLTSSPSALLATGTTAFVGSALRGTMKAFVLGGTKPVASDG